jgi:RNA-directed DNA polymerase
LVNTDELDAALYWAEHRVLQIQTKLHRWASDDPHRRFDDLYNLVTDPSFLLVAWDRVRNNKGARTAGVDGETAYYIEAVRGLDGFLAELREDLKARTFQPLPARRRAIPKAGGKVRYLGIATIRDRVAQASLKLVLEPICAPRGAVESSGGEMTPPLVSRGWLVKLGAARSWERR